ncbi:MAG: tRNA (cytidine(34)-2'-O)-methyltransferase [Polyangiaceae bacterium]
MAKVTEPLLPKAERLRAIPQVRPFHVVLVEPEIPPNTGNIARLCGATCCPLHLVGKLGFRIDEHAVRRAGLDYWHLVEVRHHEDLRSCETEIEALREPQQSRKQWFFTGRATQSFYDADIRVGDAFVFGKESVGLDEGLLLQHPDSLVAIPTLGHVRSLNLANCVSIVLFEALRRNGLLGLPQESVTVRDE